MKHLSLLSLVCGFLFATSARADFDAKPGVSDGKIVTGGHDDEQNIDKAQLSVFSYSFQEDQFSPYVIGDPGFNTLGGSPFPQNSTLTFSIVSDLRYWDGNGTVLLNPVPNGETIKFHKNSSDIVIGTGTSVPLNLLIGQFAAGGALHQHLETTLSGTETPTDGIYFLQALLHSSSTGIADSDRLWYVFNNGLSEGQLNAALAAVPEPASCTLAGAAALGLFAMRRRLRRANHV